MHAANQISHCPYGMHAYKAGLKIYQLWTRQFSVYHVYLSTIKTLKYLSKPYIVMNTIGGPCVCIDQHTIYGFKQGHPWV